MSNQIYAKMLRCLIILFPPLEKSCKEFRKSNRVISPENQKLKQVFVFNAVCPLMQKPHYLKLVFNAFDLDF